MLLIEGQFGPKLDCTGEGVDLLKSITCNMSRRYSRKKGKASSKRPLNPTTPTWVNHKPKEVEMIIAKLAKEGKSSSLIGTILRDSYGIPAVKQVVEKTITEVLIEKSLAPKIPEDMMALIRRAVIIAKHRASNKNDMTSLRGQQLTESKIKKLVKYYKATGKLPYDWKFDPESLKLYV